MYICREVERTKQGGTPQRSTRFLARDGDAPLQQIEDYWNALRGSRLLPLRSELDPREFKGALNHCFNLEWIAPGKAEFRVVGSHLAGLMEADMRGMPISSFLTADCQHDFGQALAAVIETPATASILLKAESGLGRTLRARMNLLPVASEMGATNRAIGALVSHGERGCTPCRFSVEEIILTPIVPREINQW